MKIVHVGYSHRPDDIRIFQKECASLSRYGHQVIYVTSNMNAKSVNVSNDSVKVITVKLQRTNKKLPFLLYCREIKRVLSSLDADVYHFHEVVLLSVLLYMRKQGKHVIYDMHEDSPRDMQPSLCRRRGKVLGTLLARIIEIYENYCIRKADYVITATPYIEKRCKRLTSTVCCIANYPIINKISNESCREVAGNIVKASQICYCGSLTEDRNISMYVRMMSYINGKLLLAGLLDDSYKRELENIESWDKVEYLGYLDRAGVNRLYRESDVGLCILKNLPNTYYSLPIKLFEYMEAGLPIVCSDFPIWRDIVEGNNCGLTVPYNDLESAVKAVQYILDNPMTAFVMGENGRKAVKEKYNWETEEKKLLQIYTYLGKHLY